MSIREIESDRFAKARSFKEKVTLLKGAHSFICDNDRPRPLAVCPAGNPGMATGGMGDVLSGVVGTFLAQGMDPYEAAACAATLHAEAGDICAESIGPIGYSPRDLALALPAARAKITSP
jgi:NAD(P)H-hydrate repair Nnr-like enzyme with NAD(P)H-hydrate dehydratase domain